MRKFIFFLAALLAARSLSFAQIDAALFRFPDVSATQIVFTYANDLWIVPKEGGEAIRISSPPGVEMYPKFSPDGKTIAYTADYDGNNSIYTIPAIGGVPSRLTWQGSPERVVDWYPDGQHILFASSRASGRERFDQFYKIGPQGGMSEKLPLPYAEFGTLSPDGNQLAFTFKSQIGRNWKRYRGGWNGQIHIFNLTNDSSEIISSTEADDELPMWHGNNIYFLSDRGDEKRMNLWQYDRNTKTFTQLTKFTDYDTHFPSLGPTDIVFENAGKLYLYDLAARSYKEVHVQVITDENALRPTLVHADKYIAHASISPDGHRVLVEARGDVFSIPAENGPVKDLTQTSGVAERHPAWSPDGKAIAYWSDRSGEYELTIQDNSSGHPVEKQATNYGPGFRYGIFWSPDSKKLAFIDQAMNICIYDRSTNQTIKVGKGLRMSEGGLESFTPSWSPDSRWLAYDRDMPNNHQAIFLYDFFNKTLIPVTDGYYSCSSPVFDREGKYLFLLTNQNFNPLYSDLDNTFIYPNSTKLAAIALKRTTPSPLYPKDDTVSLKQSDKGSDGNTASGDKKDKSSDARSGDKGSDTKPGDKTPSPKPVDIDTDGLESRLVFLPAEPGNYSGLQSAADGKLIFHQQPNTGDPSKEQPLKFYDLDKRKTHTIAEDVNSFQLSADGKHLLVDKDGSWYIIAVDENQKLEKKLRTAEMQMQVDPRQEWRQIFVDAWRLERDYFYDANMHGVNWGLVKERYLKMLEGAVTREEVDFIIGEMIGELNSSHTYHGGGAGEQPPHATVGYLGVDWQADAGHYRIKKIIRPAAWDAETRSPLDRPGVSIKEGDYILAVDGVELTTATEPYSAFRNLAGHSVELTYNNTPSWTGAQTAIVETMGDESRLRNLAWIEQNRHRVEEATHGDVGYIYVRSTGIDGQNDLIRQFTAQIDKKALIIDERFNSGGQVPDRFIEMLDRKPLQYSASRDGLPLQWPPTALFGPKLMMINGWSGSGGDAFPDYFRRAGIGPLLGTRTWGGLIGISGAPALIDGGGVTVPTFRMYNPDGTWFREGHGVDPDIAIPENLTLGAHGIDNQLESAIVEINELIKTKGFTPPARPARETR